MKTLDCERSLRSTIGHVVLQFGRRGRLVQDLVAVAAAAKSDAARAEAANATLRDELETAKRMLSEARFSRERTDEAASGEARRLADENKRLEREGAALRQRMQAMDHAARQREAEMQRLQGKLADVLAKVCVASPRSTRTRRLVLIRCKCRMNSARRGSRTHCGKC